MLIDDRAPTAMADAAHYTLTTQRNWTARVSASGIHEAGAPVEVGSQEGTLLYASRGYKILMSKSEHALDDATIQKKIEEQPPLVSIAFAWTKQAASKISTTKWLEKKSQSSGSSPSKTIVFVAASSPEGSVPEGLQPSAPGTQIPDTDSDDDFVPFAWAKKPIAPEAAAQAAVTDEDPLGLATVFSGQAWDQVENLEAAAAKGSSSQTESSSAAWREQVQQVVKKASEQQSGGSASSAGETLQVAHSMLVEKLAGKFEFVAPKEEAAAEAAPAEAAPVEEAAAEAAPEAAPSIEVPQATVDPRPWETDRRFQYNLRYLAWMRRADGSPMPVYEADPLNPMEVDYSEI
jgi:hypothetical protein